VCISPQKPRQQINTFLWHGTLSADSTNGFAGRGASNPRNPFPESVDSRGALAARRAGSAITAVATAIRPAFVRYDPPEYC